MIIHLDALRGDAQNTLGVCTGKTPLRFSEGARRECRGLDRETAARQAQIPACGEITTSLMSPSVLPFARRAIHVPVRSATMSPFQSPPAAQARLNPGSYGCSARVLLKSAKQQCEASLHRYICPWNSSIQASSVPSVFAARPDRLPSSYYRRHGNEFRVPPRIPAQRPRMKRRTKNERNRF